jgi:protoporphyrin/coproporphyrin ferrochelatase
MNSEPAAHESDQSSADTTSRQAPSRRAPATARTAVLLMAYGTPRTPDEILPYYTDIRRGRAPTDEQLADLTARYAALGGTSPLAARTDAQRDALQAALDHAKPGAYHVTLGLKHAAPSIETAVDMLAADGFTHLVGLVLAPHYSSYSIGQYLGRAEKAAEPHGMTVSGVQSWAAEPAFIEFIADDLRQQLTAMPDGALTVFTAHSLPQRIIDAGDPYPHELRSTAEAVAKAAGLSDSQWTIGWQSAGRTPEPWIGPDVLEVIDTAAADGVPGLVVSAVGFVADHLEVLYDLDIEAAARAKSRGIAFARTRCVNDDPAVMAALADRVIGVT